MSLVEHDPAHRLWLLRTPESSYAFRLDADDRPRHVHWGPPLTLAQATQVAERRNPAESSFDEPGDERLELPTEGGAFFGVAALAARFEDGTSALEWRYAGHSSTEDTLDLRLADRHYPLELSLHYRVRGDVIERWTTLRTTGDAEIALLRTDSASWTLPRRDGARLSRTSGAWSAEYGVLREPLPVGETTLTSRRGVSSHQVNPWVMLDAGDATETSGEVWSTALAWSGSWRITVDHTHTGRVTWTGGFGHENVSWRLKPGETWETPVFAGLYAADGFGGTSRLLARLRPRVRPAALRRAAADRLQLLGSDRLGRRRADRNTTRRGRGEARRRAVRDGRRLVRRPHRRHRRTRRLDRQRAALPRRARAARRRGARARDEVRAVGRAGDGQPGQRPLPRAPGLGAAHGEPHAHDVAQPARAQLRPPGRRGLGAQVARPARRRARDRLPQVGHEPRVHRGRVALDGGSGTAVGRPRPRGLRDLRPAAGRSPRPADPGVRGRRRPHRPGDPRAHRRDLGVGQHGRGRPDHHPARLRPALPHAARCRPGSPTARTRPPAGRRR